ncbi:MAG TPA: hypothetical protein VFA95_14855 [Gammaproteobacteria bacterium]|nr:hypothetical protein [Gammaproteobacteria bacterium]
MMIWRMVLAVLLAGAMVLPVARAGDRIGTVPRSAWSQVHGARDVLAIPVLKQAVGAWTRHPRDHILIQYSGGRPEAARASGVRDWLIALGVPGSAVQVLPGPRGFSGVAVSVGF